MPRGSYFYHRACFGLPEKHEKVRRKVTEIFMTNVRFHGYRPDVSTPRSDRLG
jgi:hypothetical protein